MKIITLHSRIDPGELREYIRQNLSPLFSKQRQSELKFTVAGSESIIEVSQPELYEGVLFHIEIKGNELHITRSEHYVDDVNSLTVESILNELFKDVAKKNGTDLIQEG
jgi:hypothetical protein